MLEGGTPVPTNADLNSYNKPGVYYCINSNVAKTISNTPLAIEFKFLVEYQFGNNSNYIMQTFINYITMSRYCRRSEDAGKTWKTWYKMDAPIQL